MQLQLKKTCLLAFVFFNITKAESNQNWIAYTASKYVLFWGNVEKEELGQAFHNQAAIESSVGLLK